MTWFSSQTEFESWVGLSGGYPFTPESFRKALKLDTYLSLALQDEHDNMVAFGQCYVRLERLHLARLVVGPEHRGTGLVSVLIEALTARGGARFGASELSLFVMHNNSSAIRAYEKLGFESVDYPEENPLEACFYMIKPIS